MLLSALLFALIWDAFLFLTWERTKDGFVFVTVLFTTNSDVFVRVLPRVTYRLLTIRYTENSFASKKCSTLTSPPSICTCEFYVAFWTRLGALAFYPLREHQARYYLIPKTPYTSIVYLL